MADWKNWSGIESAHPDQALTPRSTVELSRIVADASTAGRRVKMVGTGHSFTAISAPVSGPLGVMLSPAGMRGGLQIDRSTMTATAQAGTQLKELNAALAAHGLSLHNMGDIAEQTLAGAVSTGTHGTGGRVAGLAGQLAAVELVAGDGSVHRFEESDADFDLVRVGLGALGVLTRLTFHVEPLFGLRATETPLAWTEFVDRFEELIADHDGVPAHLDAYWFPHTDRIATKRNVRVGLDELEPLPSWRAWLEDDVAQNTVFGALCRVTNRFPQAIPAANRLAARTLAARSYADLAHRVFVAERRVVFREMEYAVPLDSGLEVLAQCRRAIEACDLRINFPVELRVAQPDTGALSTASGRASLYLAFHVHRDVDHRPYFALLEPILREAGGRPHWGKVHTLGRDQLAERYPRFEEFLRLRDRLDPSRTFSNPYLERTLGA